MNSALEPMTRRLINFGARKTVKADQQVICSFTLERCLLDIVVPGAKEEGEQICPFTLEPVCMKTRALEAGRD